MLALDVCIVNWLRVVYADQMTASCTLARRTGDVGAITTSSGMNASRGEQNECSCMAKMSCKTKRQAVVTFRFASFVESGWLDHVYHRVRSTNLAHGAYWMTLLQVRLVGHRVTRRMQGLRTTD